MGALVKMLKSFFSTIGSLIDFIVDFFADLVYVIGVLGNFLLNIPDYFSWLPAEIVALLVTTFGVVVIYMVLGRD